MICDGKCSTLGECHGEVQPYDVYLGYTYWGDYNLCKTAVASDRARHFTVTPITLERTWLKLARNSDDR